MFEIVHRETGRNSVTVMGYIGHFIAWQIKKVLLRPFSYGAFNQREKEQYKISVLLRDTPDRCWKPHNANPQYNHEF